MSASAANLPPACKIGNPLLLAADFLLSLQKKYRPIGCRPVKTKPHAAKSV